MSQTGHPNATVHSKSIKKEHFEIEPKTFIYHKHGVFIPKLECEIEPQLRVGCLVMLPHKVHQITGVYMTSQIIRFITYFLWNIVYIYLKVSQNSRY